MKTELRNKWVAALRSGEYRHGHGRNERHHYQGQKFCVLGVACLVAEQAGVIVRRAPDGDGRLIGTGLRTNGGYQRAVGIAFGLTLEGEYLLAEFNDEYDFENSDDPEGFKYAFWNLADYIERNEQNLFI